LQAAYYAREENWAQHEPQASEILAGFEVVRGTVEPADTSGPVLTGVVRGALIGAAGGALLALVLYLVRQTRRPKG